MCEVEQNRSGQIKHKQQQEPDQTKAGTGKVG